MIDICMSLSDLDPNEDCHMVIVHRFMVEEPEASIGRVGYLVALVPITTLVWLGSSLRIGPLPLPAYVVLLIMGFAVMIPAASLPNVVPEQGTTAIALALKEPEDMLAAKFLLS